jgi:hypothetical protein
VAIAALVLWLATIGAGWSLLAIWLVEYDRTFHESATTRLPISVMGLHALCALGGLAVWIAYLLAGSQRLLLTSTAILGLVAVLGFIMVTRWIGVWRAHKARVAALNDPFGGVIIIDVPPERHLPVTLVIGHGVLAVTTVILVVLTALHA